ncbi:hypothetical protein BGZ65_011534, partial [Modicella reniformis]
MDSQPLNRANLIPLSLLSTSVFERSRKVSIPPQPAPSAVPRTSAIGSSSGSPNKKEPQDASLPPGHRVGLAKNMDPFVEGQSRRGRQQYETGHRPPVDRGRNDPRDDMYCPTRSRSANKRRVQSSSPESRKRPAGSNGMERSSRPTAKTAVTELSPISPITSPLTRPIAVMSPLSSSASEADEMGAGHCGQRRHHSSSNHITSDAANSRHSSKRPRSSQRSNKRSSSSRSRRFKRRRFTRDSWDSSSSTLSDSDSESSSSEDPDQEIHQPSGSSALRFHGIIHDLMLELERARTKYSKYCEKAKSYSRKIRNISKKLEKHFRDLNDAVSVTPASAAERTPLSRRTSSTGENVVMATSSMSTTRGFQPLATDRRAQQQQANPQQAAQYPSGQRQPVQSMSSSTQERKPSSSSSSFRLAQQHDRMAIGSSDVIETLTNIHADVRNKAFGRKPRNMLLHSSIAGSDMEDVMVTSSLEGSIEFWDLGNRRVMSMVPRSHLNQPWCEDMCWVGKNVLAVASAHKDNVPLNHQLTLIHIEKGRVPRAVLGQPGPTVAWRLQTLTQMPHDRKGGIMCISAIAEDVEGMSLATGAADKQIIHWKFVPSKSNGDCALMQQQLIHNKHTSAVQALCYVPQSHLLFSGGSDCKVVGWDMVRSEVVLEYKHKDGRVNSILQNPVDPNLFLVCRALTSNQLS